MFSSGPQALRQGEGKGRVVGWEWGWDFFFGLQGAFLSSVFYAENFFLHIYNWDQISFHHSLQMETSRAFGQTHN